MHVRAGINKFNENPKKMEIEEKRRGEKENHKTHEKETKTEKQLESHNFAMHPVRKIYYILERSGY